MPTLTLGQTSPLVKLFNDFLTSRGFPSGDGDRFDDRAREGTRRLQQWLVNQNPKARQKLIRIDGIAGNQTLGYACAISEQDWLEPSVIARAVGVPYPARDTRLPTASNSLQESVFGHIEFKPARTEENPDGIVIINSFVDDYMVKKHVPQLLGKMGAPKSATLSLHKRIAAQFLALWAAWDAQGLTSSLTGFGGMWVPRYKRGSKTELSNHSWGTAFDVNVSANYLSHLPAFPGENGCLFEHVPIAQDYGFGWGGHYRQRLDGMHFEALRVLTEDELEAVNARYAERTD